MDPRPRWLVLGTSGLAVVTLSVFGKLYHQWLLGIVAAIGVTVISNLLYSFARMRASRPRRPSRNQQAVTVRLVPPGRRVSDTISDDLWTLETELTDIIERQHLGEYDGNEISESGASLFMYGPNAEALFHGVEGILRASSLCKRAIVQVRPGPMGTPHREVLL